MNQLNKIVFIISFIVCLLGLVATCVFLALAPDAQWWLFLVVFLVGTLWFGSNLLRSLRKK